jgi:high-affinity nickel permease
VLGLIAANLLAWCWALQAFGDSGALMAASLLAWGYGLRHAVDADHIAAIDNVTRKMMQQGRRPFAVGAWFSLGHSSIVVLASAAIAATATAFGADELVSRDRQRYRHRRVGAVPAGDGLYQPGDFAQRLAQLSGVEAGRKGER